MKNSLLHPLLLTCLLLFGGPVFSQPPDSSGVIEGTIQWEHNDRAMYYRVTWPWARVYDANWNRVRDYFVESHYRFSDLPTGDYYVWADIFIEEWRDPCCIPPYGGNPNCWSGDPWIEEYWNDSPGRSGATRVHVVSGDTTRNIDFDIDRYGFFCVRTLPFVLSFQVDGVRHVSPQPFSWKEGETHALDPWEFVETEDGGRLYFREWEHGGARMQSYTVPYPIYHTCPSDTLTAWYDSRLHLEVFSPYGNPAGGGWHNAHSVLQVAVEDTVLQYMEEPPGFLKPSESAAADSALRIFVGWTGTGAGSYTGAENPAQVTLDANLTETTLWRTEFPLHVEVNDTAMGVVALSAGGTWHPEDSTVTLTARPFPGFRFIAWEGDTSGTDTTLCVVMDTSRTILCIFAASAAPIHASCAFDEDSALFIPADTLAAWFSDPAAGFFPVAFEAADSSACLHGHMAAAGLTVTADPDWNGSGLLLIGADDGRGGRVVDTLACVVRPVDDPPGPFFLLEPADRAFLPYGEEPVFRWTASANADAMNGDRILYTLFFPDPLGMPVVVSGATQDTFLVIGIMDPGSYRWKVSALDLSAASVDASPDSGLVFTVGPSGLDDEDRLPEAFRLMQNYPNPFNSRTEWVFEVPIRSDVTIEVYSAEGRRIRTLEHGTSGPGRHVARWDGKDDSGRDAGSGLYFCRMKAGRFSTMVKAVYLK